MTMFPFPVLVGDIGGTNARFARVDTAGSPARLVARLKTADYADAPDGLRAALDAAGSPRPRSVILCGAGPRQGRSLDLTNAHWRLDGPALASALRIDQGLIVNDFEAQALALPFLPPGAIRRIGPARPAGAGPIVALGPGTGLGVAALIGVEGRFMPLATEAGHCDIGPAGAAQAAFWPYLERVGGRISAESLLSGPGLERLHRARLISVGGLSAAMVPAVSAAEIGAAAAAGDRQAIVTATTLWQLLARFAGDMALAYLATGGVFVMGGIAPRLAAALDDTAFRAAFEAKPPMEGLLRDIPTSLVLETDAALHGLAGLAARPEVYLLDYQERLWTEQRPA